MGLPQLDINRGECLDLALRYVDENGLPIDVSGNVFSLTESPVGTIPVFVIGDAPAGLVNLSIMDTSMFRLGRLDWIRIGMLKLSGCMDTTPPIQVNVQ